MAGEVQTSHSAIDADGDSITIWERFVGNGQSSIEFRRRSAAGALGPVGVLADRATSNGVAVAVADDGDAMLMWSGQGVQARWLSAAGVLGPLIQLANPEEDASGLELAIGADGAVVFGWQRAGGVRARVLSSTGALGPVRYVSAATTDGLILTTRKPLALARSGTATFVWQGESSHKRSFVKARSLTAKGVLSRTRTLARGDLVADPQIAALSRGRTALAWTDERGVWVRMRTASGRLRHRVRLFGKGFEQPRLASLPGGKVLVAANGDSGLIARTLSARQKRGPTSKIAAGVNSYALGTRPSGSAWFLWARGAFRGQDFVVRARSRRRSGKLGPTAHVARDCAADPQLAVAARGPVLATWLSACGNMPGHRLVFAAGPVAPVQAQAATAGCAGRGSRAVCSANSGGQISR